MTYRHVDPSATSVSGTRRVGTASSLFDLSGRVAIVTSAHGGIGFAIAEGLASAGARVILAGRDPAKTAAAPQRIQSSGGSATSLGVDLTKGDSVMSMVDSVLGSCGRIDVLVTKTGTRVPQLPERDEPASWRAGLDPSLGGALVC